MNEKLKQNIVYVYIYIYSFWTVLTLHIFFPLHVPLLQFRCL